MSSFLAVIVQKIGIKSSQKDQDLVGIARGKCIKILSSFTGGGLCASSRLEKSARKTKIEARLGKLLKLKEMVGNGNNLLSMGLPTLTEKNWDRWCTQMKSQRSTHIEAKKKDNKTLFLIHQFVDDVHVEKIQNATTSKEACNILIRSHAGGEKIKNVKLQTLRRQYVMLKMEESDRIGDYFTKILTITNQMKGYGESITDLMIIEKIMRSLPQKFDYIVVSIEESKDVNAMRIEELQSSLEAHELRMLDRNPIKNTMQALKANHFKDDDRMKDKKWKGKASTNKRWNQGFDRKKSDQEWPESSDRRGRQRGFKNRKSYDKKKVECFNCHALGHYSYECPKDKTKHGKNQERLAYVT
ncbi:hypothetical protein Lal_00047237 [Lupinus albus]|nr:hypothetical protein Lal_00047237 [Lupinus albus]